MSEFFFEYILEYSYLILFVWAILEGETGLIITGTLAKLNQLDITYVLIFGILGGFAGDQMYYWIGKYNKKFVYSKLQSQRRKFATAKVLLKKHGAYIIFFLRFMYGFRLVLPLTIGVTNYNPKKFAILNFLGSILWGVIYGLLGYFFGNIVLNYFQEIVQYWYVVPIVLIIIYYARKYLKQRRDKQF